MEDVITNPPPTGRYEKINAKLIRRLSLSEEQRVHQLLMQEKMGDWRPTQFLRHIRTLASPSFPSDFLRTLWTNSLPPNIQAIIATQVQVTVNDVAQLADKISDVTPPPSVARLSSSGGDICTLPILTSWLGKWQQFPRASLVRVRLHGHDGMPLPCHTSSSPGPICYVGFVYRCSR